jgi:hypothetical protein
LVVAWIDGFGMIFAVIICVLVTAVNDSQKEKQFAELNKSAEQNKMVTYF